MQKSSLAPVVDRLNAQKQQETALGDMELWSRREKETSEYSLYIAREEVTLIHRQNYFLKRKYYIL